MAYQQVPKLYLRGSLCNKVLKELEPEQRNEVERVIHVVMKDPNLQSCKREFCNALARTIRNDYEDNSVAEQDFMMSVMKAAVAALHGYGKKEPVPEAITDPIQRKKWFQTWAFNYLRQILRENKLPTTKHHRTLTLPPEQAALNELQRTIQNTIDSEHDHRYKARLKQAHADIEIQEEHNGYFLCFDHWSFPIKLVDDIRELSIMYFKLGVIITPTSTGILIKKVRNVSKTVTVKKHSERLVRMTSFETDQDERNGKKDKLEWTATKFKGGKGPMTVVEETDVLSVLRQKIPDDAKPVLDIYLEDTRPQAFIDRYGDKRPRISHVATYLGKSPREIKRMLTIIRNHCFALGVGR